MFCPKCGTAGKGKSFCTRCGLQLALVCYQGVPVTNRVLIANHNAPTIRVKPNLATQKFAAPTASNEIARVTTVATAYLRPAVAAHAKRLRQFAPMFVGVLLLLLVTASGFWWRKSQGQIVQAQTVTSTQSKQSDSGDITAVKIEGHNLTTNAAQTEPTQTSAHNYEWAIIGDQTRGVNTAEDALLADEKMAAIAPGGQLALDFRAGQFFGNGPQADLQIFGTGQKCVAYRLFVRNDPTAAWQRVDINRKTFTAGVAGHDMGHHGIQQARQVLIRNDAQSELHIDAVSALYSDVIAVVSHSKSSQLLARKALVPQSSAHKRTVAFSGARRVEKSAKKNFHSLAFSR